MAKFSDIAPAPPAREWMGKYLNADEKRAAVGEVFRLVYIEFRPTGYQGKPEWDCGIVDAGTGHEWTVTLTDNPRRHAMFEAVAKAIAAGETVDPVVFDIVGTNKRGNPPYGFRDATAEEIAGAVERRRAWNAAHPDGDPVDEDGTPLPIPTPGTLAGEPLPF